MCPNLAITQLFLRTLNVVIDIPSVMTSAVGLSHSILLVNFGAAPAYRPSLAELNVQILYIAVHYINTADDNSWRVL